MYARAVDEASERLRDLRWEAWGDVALAAVAVGLALAAGENRPSLQTPLLIGALFAFSRGIRAWWRRWELVDRLLLDPAAHNIPEIRRRAGRSATLERRRSNAESLRCVVDAPEPLIAARVASAREELEALAADLENDELRLDAAAAVACDRLATDGFESPLLNSTHPDDELLPRVRQIRAGFSAGDVPGSGRETERQSLRDAA